MENLNLNIHDDELSRPQNRNYNKQRKVYDDDALPHYRQPQIVVNNDEEEANLNSLKANSLDNLNKHSLIDKKKLKWQQDKRNYKFIL